jgi:hypothetical protein
MSSMNCYVQINYNIVNLTSSNVTVPYRQYTPSVCIVDNDWIDMRTTHLLSPEPINVFRRIVIVINSYYYTFAYVYVHMRYVLNMQHNFLFVLQAIFAATSTLVLLQNI